MDAATGGQGEVATQGVHNKPVTMWRGSWNCVAPMLEPCDSDGQAASNLWQWRRLSMADATTTARATSSDGELREAALPEYAAVRQAEKSFNGDDVFATSAAS